MSEFTIFVSSDVSLTFWLWSYEIIIIKPFLVVLKMCFPILILIHFNFDFLNLLVLPIWKNNQMKMEYLFRMKILKKS